MNTANTEVHSALSELQALIQRKASATEIFPLTHALKWHFSAINAQTVVRILKRMEWLCDRPQEEARKNLTNWHQELANHLLLLTNANPLKFRSEAQLTPYRDPPPAELV